MKLFAKLAMAAAFATAILATSTAQASDQASLLRAATETARHMKHDPSFSAARDMLRRARAVLIIPNLVRGGFIFGAEGGDGVLLARGSRHGWSSPAFYNMGSASFGFQAGLEKAEIVLLVMSDRALRALERSEFKFGAGAGLTVVTASAGVEGATAPNLSGDIVVWTSATGAYGGLTLKGSVVKADDDRNADFYGRSVSVPTILASGVRNPMADDLRDELASVR
jgi:lipid-binding SYLF domain-containing protein